METLPTVRCPFQFRKLPPNENINCGAENGSKTLFALICTNVIVCVCVLLKVSHARPLHWNWILEEEKNNFCWHRRAYNVEAVSKNTVSKQCRTYDTYSSETPNFVNDSEKSKTHTHCKRYKVKVFPLLDTIQAKESLSLTKCGAFDSFYAISCRSCANATHSRTYTIFIVPICM